MEKRILRHASRDVGVDRRTLPEAETHGVVRQLAARGLHRLFQRENSPLQADLDRQEEQVMVQILWAKKSEQCKVYISMACRSFGTVPLTCRASTLDPATLRMLHTLRRNPDAISRALPARASPELPRPLRSVGKLE